MWLPNNTRIKADEAFKNFGKYRTKFLDFVSGCDQPPTKRKSQNPFVDDNVHSLKEVLALLRKLTAEKAKASILSPVVIIGPKIELHITEHSSSQHNPNFQQQQGVQKMTNAINSILGNENRNNNLGSVFINSPNQQKQIVNALTDFLSLVEAVIGFNSEKKDVLNHAAVIEGELKKATPDAGYIKMTFHRMIDCLGGLGLIAEIAHKVSELNTIIGQLMS
jgi:hypothetical protein